MKQLHLTIFLNGQRIENILGKEKPKSDVNLKNQMEFIYMKNTVNFKTWWTCLAANYTWQKREKTERISHNIAQREKKMESEEQKLREIY